MTRAILLLAGGLVSLMAFGALLTLDRHLQSTSPVASGRVGTEMTFTGDPGRYTIRLGRRGGARISGDLTLQLRCRVDGVAVIQQAKVEGEASSSPLIGTFEHRGGRGRVACAWPPRLAFRGAMPVFVAKERTTLRRLGYAALILAIAMFAAGGWSLYRALTGPASSQPST